MGAPRLLIGGLVMRGPGDWILNGAVAISDDKVAAIGPADSVLRAYPDAETVGSAEHVVLPGMVNGHHHAWGLTVQALGGADDFLEPWLVGLAALPQLPPFLSTLAAAMRQVRAGVTTVVHSAGSGYAEDYAKEMEARLEAYRAAGLRVAFAPGFTDVREIAYGDAGSFVTSLPQSIRDPVQEWLATQRVVSLSQYLDTLDFLIEKFQHTAPQHVQIAVSPLSPIWVSDHSLEQLATFARSHDLPMHTHLLESVYQREWARRTHGMSEVAHLAGMGFLGPQLSCAHAVWVSEDDLELLRDRSVTVVTNPSSNLRLRSGIAPVLPMLGQGINLSMGMDGNTFDDGDDFFQELRLLYRLHRLPGLREPSLEATQVLTIATAGGAGWPGHPTGTAALAVGHPADILVLRQPALIALVKSGAVRPDEALVTYGSSRFITDVMIGGDFIVREGAFKHLDEEAIVSQLLADLEQELRVDRSADRALVDQIRAHIETFFRTWEIPEFVPWYTYNVRR
jgi:5-methylthioadenosine/S-adenosylhomocysteine deaminase